MGNGRLIDLLEDLNSGQSDREVIKWTVELRPPYAKDFMMHQDMCCLHLFVTNAKLCPLFINTVFSDFRFVNNLVAESPNYFSKSVFLERTLPPLSGGLKGVVTENMQGARFSGSFQGPSWLSTALVYTLLFDTESKTRDHRYLRSNRIVRVLLQYQDHCLHLMVFSTFP